MILLFALSATAALNDGRTLLHHGDLPAAILAYRRGLANHPADAALQTDLLAARELVDYSSDTPRPPGFMHWRHHVSERELFSLFSTAILIGAVAVFRTSTTRPRWAPPLAFLSIAVALASVVTAQRLAVVNARERSAVIGVVMRPTPLREGNGASYPAMLELPAGLETMVLHERGGWLQIELSNGMCGWVWAADLPKQSARD